MASTCPWGEAAGLRQGDEVALALQQRGSLLLLILINERPSSGPKFGATAPTEGVMFPCGKTMIALALLMATPVGASAQTADKPADPAVQAQPANQPPPTAELLKPEQLEALVAPIALYPDELLANV